MDSGRGWLVVAAATIATFTVFGVAYSFGGFFSAMSEDFGTGKGKTTLLFGIANFVYFTGGILTGRLCDRIGPRPLLALAGVSLFVGLLTTSFVDHLWLGYLTYGFGVGIAVACAYVPMVSVVGGWFVRRRTAAVGIAVAGIGLGSLTANYLSPRLIDDHGWRATYRVYSVAGTVLLVVALLLAERPPPATTRAPERATTLREIASKTELPAPLRLDVRDVARAVHPLRLPAQLRPGPRHLLQRRVDAGRADRRGERPRADSPSERSGGAPACSGLYQACLAAMSATMLLWLVAGSSYPALLFFAVVFGVVYGGFIALAPAVTAQVYGTEGLGMVLGALYTAAAFGGIGLYIAGENIDATGRYGPSIVAALVLSALSAVLLLPLRRYEAPAAG